MPKQDISLQITQPVQFALDKLMTRKSVSFEMDVTSAAGLALQPGDVVTIMGDLFRIVRIDVSENSIQVRAEEKETDPEELLPIRTSARAIRGLVPRVRERLGEMFPGRVIPDEMVYATTAVLGHVGQIAVTNVLKKRCEELGVEFPLLSSKSEATEEAVRTVISHFADLLPGEIKCGNSLRDEVV